MGSLSWDRLLRGFGVKAMPGDRFLIPRQSAAGAVRDVLRPMQEGGGKTTIEAAVQVDHVVHALTGVAVHEESGTGRAPALALLGIAREALAGRGVADGKIEAVADPDT